MSDLQIVKVTVTARRKGKLENVKLIQKWQLIGKASFALLPHGMRT